MKAAYEDNFVTAYCGDALEVMRKLPARSVHCCVTSPPYWGLRSYLADDHESKKSELGLERTPEEYVGRMVKYFRQVKRLLRKDGTLWLNLGDSYATGAGKVSTAPGGGKQGEKFKAHFGKNTASPRTQDLTQPNRMPLPGLKPKDMVGIPWRVAFALQADGWYLRSEIIWNKPNPMPESVTDRPTKSHETIFLLTKSPRYFYDAEAIKESNSPGSIERFGLQDGKQTRKWDTSDNKRDGRSDGTKSNEGFRDHVPFGRNKRTVWTVATEGYDAEACLACRRVYSGAEYRRLRRENVEGITRVYCVCGAYDQWKSHYATFPPNLILPCILAGTSDRGACPECGGPWTRLIESKKHFESGSGKSGNPIAGKNGPECQGGGDTGDIRKGPVLESKTVGWEPGCKCGVEPEPCVVLDPFAGSGTTGQVARETGRKAILIELNPDDINLLMTHRFKQELLEL